MDYPTKEEAIEKSKGFIKKYRNELIITGVAATLFGLFAWRHRNCVWAATDSTLNYVNQTLADEVEKGILTHVSGKVMYPIYHRG